MKPVKILAFYERNAFGPWSAEVIPDQKVTKAVGVVQGRTLVECQERVLDAVQELADSLNRGCRTLHTIGGDPEKFAQAYEAETGRPFSP